jgi:hypothetical protein
MNEWAARREREREGEGRERERERGRREEKREKRAALGNCQGNERGCEAMVKIAPLHSFPGGETFRERRAEN